MKTMEAILKRRSIRQFTRQSIAQEDLNTLLRAAMMAPTARNCQEWEFVVVRDKNMFKKVKHFVDEGNLRQALNELYQINNPVIADNEILKAWMDKVQAKVNFNQAIANISAHSLALMKVNSLKNN